MSLLDILRPPRVPAPTGARLVSFDNRHSNDTERNKAWHRWYARNRKAILKRRKERGWK